MIRALCQPRCFGTAVAIVVALSSVPRTSKAAPLTNTYGGPAGFGVNSLPASDDGSSAAINVTAAVPQLILYAQRVTDVYVNNNGNVSLGGPNPNITPQSLPTASTTMIAPFWGDVDTRAGGAPSNSVYWHVEAGKFVVTWFEVGYYALHTDKRNSFQMTITPAAATGDFDLELRYARCEWTTGDASGGSGGLGGSPADAGLDAGNHLDALRMPVASTLDLCTASNTGTPGLWQVIVRGGQPSLCGNDIAEGIEECDGTDVPNGSVCKPDCTRLFGNGETCTAGSECASGFCAQDVCCNFACDAGICQTCLEAQGATADGTCTNLTGPVCDDDDACTPADTCQAGLCVGTGTPSCDPADDCHVVGTCDPSSGVCSEPAAADGTPCNGGNGACMAGVCEPVTSDGGGSPTGGGSEGGSGEGGSSAGGSASGGGSEGGSGSGGRPDEGGSDSGTDEGSTSGCDCRASGTRSRGGFAALAVLAAIAIRRRRGRGSLL